jgi:hypothetical protein
METLWLALWSVIGIHLAWFLFCIGLKTTTRNRALSMTTWHYRWMRTMFNSIPTDACRYFGKLMITPHCTVVLACIILVMLFLAGLRGLLFILWDFLISPVVLGQYTTTYGPKGYHRIPVSPFTKQYWTTNFTTSSHSRVYASYSPNKFLPVPPIGILLVIAFLFVYGESGMEVYEGTASYLGYSFFWGMSLIITIVLLMMFRVFRPSAPAFWEALTKRLCWEITLDR